MLFFSEHCLVGISWNPTIIVTFRLVFSSKVTRKLLQKLNFQKIKLIRRINPYIFWQIIQLKRNLSVFRYCAIFFEKFQFCQRVHYDFLKFLKRKRFQAQRSPLFFLRLFCDFFSLKDTRFGSLMFGFETGKNALVFCITGEKKKHFTPRGVSLLGFFRCNEIETFFQKDSLTLWSIFAVFSRRFY